MQQQENFICRSIISWYDILKLIYGSVELYISYETSDCIFNMFAHSYTACGDSPLHWLL